MAEVRYETIEVVLEILRRAVAELAEGEEAAIRLVYIQLQGKDTFSVVMPEGLILVTFCKPFEGVLACLRIFGPNQETAHEALARELVKALVNGSVVELRTAYGNGFAQYGIKPLPPLSTLEDFPGGHPGPTSYN